VSWKQSLQDLVKRASVVTILNQWPKSIVPKASKETEEEAKLRRELVAAAVEINDEFEDLFSKYCFWSAFCIMAWIRRFLTMARNHGHNLFYFEFLTNLHIHFEIWLQHAVYSYFN
jgi:hypothetical protein